MFTLSFGVIAVRKPRRVKQRNQRVADIPDAVERYVGRNTICVLHIDGLVQERCNSIADALELRISFTNPSILFLWLYNHRNVSMIDTYGMVMLPVSLSSSPRWMKSGGKNTYDTCKCNFINGISQFRYYFHWSLFLGVWMGRVSLV